VVLWPNIDGLSAFEATGIHLYTSFMAEMSFAMTCVPDFSRGNLSEEDLWLLKNWKRIAWLFELSRDGS